MKAVTQLATAGLAAAGLLFQVASQATNLAEQPLKASVLAKPNVVFAMDDSGSMDAEVLIDGTYQGWVYGNTSNATLYPSSAPRSGSNSGDWQMFYLFPNGSGTGNRVYSDPSTKYGYAIPPTPQMAWTRSSSYNQIYYNPAKTYSPWSPAYISSATKTFANATPSAAKSHPVLGSTTMALNATLTSSSSDWVFTFTAGMIIPSGATGGTCSSGSVGTLPYTVTTSNKYCTATVPYYPATYWVKTSCTVDGTTCVTNYDGNTLKRYEIKSGNTFPSGRSYADEMQNFANWFTYYRKRRLLVGAAMGNVLENMTGLNMGVVAFNAQSAPTMYDADATTASSNGLVVTGKFYSAEGDGGTPTHSTFSYVRGQFNTNTGIIKYACQRNAAFIITDGFANDSSVTPPTYSQSTYGSGVPYQSITSGSLADQALAYFTLTLRSDLATGKVPLGSQTVTNPDSNPNLHLNTYAITLGAKGTLWPANTDAFASTPTWPTPTSNTASMIDDLWHATINGRGQMYLATDAETAATSIQAGLADIKSQVGAQSAVAVSTVNLLSGDGQAYLASYNPAGWTGDLTANAINATTGTVASTGTWSADTLLRARDWSTRVIVTADGGSGTGSHGLAFTAGNVGSTVNPDSSTYTNSGVVEYLRGNRTDEGTTYRTRSSLIGAVINAEPVVDSTTSVVYLASGEGMLHAFATSTGAEQWAFVPYAGLSALGATIERGYAFKTKLDATPGLGKYTAAGARLLVGGMGAAGRSYYALDVSSPTGLTETQAAAQVKWTFPSTTQSSYQTYLGYTVGTPLIVKTSTQGYVVLVTSGYDNGYTIGDGKGRMWMLNADTGAVITEFVTTAGTTAAEAGLTHITGYYDDDGTVRYVYGGDLLGNLWRFDLKLGTTTLIATLKNSSGTVQPITTKPLLTEVDGKRLVMVGTGRLLDSTDFGTTAVQSFYAITDTTDTALASARTALTALTLNTSTYAITGTVDWTSSRGWYVDLPSGQVINVHPELALGYIYFNTNVTGGSNCAQSSYAYVVKVLSGNGSYELASSTANATHPLLVQSGDKVFRWIRFNNSEMATKDVTPSDPISARKNSWKAISR